MTIMTAPVRSAGTFVLAYLLQALGATGDEPLGRHPGMPEATIHLDRQGVVLSVTDAEAPALRRVATDLAAAARYDVVLARLGEVGRDIVDVSVDLTLALLPCTPWTMNDLALWEGRDETLWLVGEGFGASVAIGVEGCTLEMTPPYETLAQRSAGILRAGGRLARLLRDEVRG